VGGAVLALVLGGVPALAVPAQPASVGTGDGGAPAPASAASSSRALSGAFMPVDEIRAGMKGTGRTVFRGDTIEEFGVEIIGVVKGARAQGDLILFRGEGPILSHTGIIAGMSGSPVYIDGRLIGAVAFNYSLSKDPIGAITPIGEMLKLLEIPQNPGEMEWPHGSDPKRVPPVQPPNVREAPGSSPMHPAGMDPAGRAGSYDQLLHAFVEGIATRGRPAGGRAGQRNGVAAPVAGEAKGGAGSPRQTAPLEGPFGRTGTEAGSLRPLAIPVVGTGWAPEINATMSGTLSSLGFAPASLPAGGAVVPETTSPFEPGSAVAVQLVGGDANLAAIGTVTYVEGDRLLAFGHPMMQAGPLALPMSRAWIHTVLPNLDISFKIGSASGIVGRLWEDRRPGIAGHIGEIPPMLPIRVTLRGGMEGETAFRYEVARHASLTANLIPWAIGNSYMSRGWIQGDAAVRSKISVKYNGGSGLTRTDRFQTDSPGLQIATEIAYPALLLLTNPFEAVRLDSIAVDLEYERENEGAQLVALRCDDDQVQVGDTLDIRLTIEPYRGEREERRVQVPVPGGWAGQKLEILAGGAGDIVDWDRERAPEKYAPRDLRLLAEYIERVPNDGELVVRVGTRRSGSVVQGIELPVLPPSFQNAGAGTGGRSVISRSSGALLMEKRLESPWVTRGRLMIEVEVLSR